MNYPKVSIIILNWNGWKDTIECLHSLSKITYSNFEVIVVDNGSKKESVQNLKCQISDFKSTFKKLNLRLIENKENLGFAKGNNVAIKQVLKEGESDFVLLLNNDTVVDKNFLTKLVNAVQGQDEVGIAGPKVYYYGTRSNVQASGSMINLYLGKFPRIKDSKRIQRVDFVIGACFLIKTSVIKKIGLLDERFFLLFEEMDWCWRAKKAGYTILYVPDSIIWHKVSRSFEREKISQTYYYTRNLFWFEFKHAAVYQLLFFLIYYFIFIFPQYFFGFLIVKRNYKLWKSYMRGLIEGVLGGKYRS